jgi:hypothetical protein
MQAMSQHRCAVCGRPVDGLVDARLGDGRWFCSQSHLLEWESRRQRRRVPRRVRVVGASAAVVLALILWWQVGGPYSPSGLGDRETLIQAVQQATHQMEADEKHPFVYRVHLTRQAETIADSYVNAEYVTHDCKALSNLTLRLPRMNSVSGPIGSAYCRDWLENGRENDAHLVRRSRMLKHKGCLVAGLTSGYTLRANECLQYATEGRYITLDNGTRDPECDGSFFDVFLKKINGRWFVVAESDSLDWGGGCQARDISFWKRRITWRNP